MNQLVSPVFARGHISAKTKTKPSDVQLITTLPFASRLEGSDQTIAVHGDFQDADRFCAGGWKRAASPSRSVESEGGCVNRFVFPTNRIIGLSFSPFFRRERILPTEVIPIIDVKRNRDEIVPKLRLIFQSTEPAFRWDTTATTFRGIELDQMCPGRLAFEDEFIGTRSYGKEKEKPGKPPAESYLKTKAQSSIAPVLR